jgi:hypothetical protein
MIEIFIQSPKPDPLPAQKKLSAEGLFIGSDFGIYRIMVA